MAAHDHHFVVDKERLMAATGNVQVGQALHLKLHFLALCPLSGKDTIRDKGQESNQETTTLYHHTTAFLLASLSELFT